MKRALLLCAAVTALWATACSGGGGGIAPPPPTGNFSNASMNGTYVFSMSGRTIDPNNPSGAGVDNFSRVGIFIADGKGGIATNGGLEDIHIFGSDNLIPLTGGSYTINADGRGTLNLINSSGTLNFSITMVSSSNGYIVAMPSDGSSTAGGSFQLQTATTLAANTYVFDFAGIAPDNTGNPISFIGDFQPDGAGGVTSSSFADVNEGGNFVTKALLQGGTITMDNASLGTGRGFATFGNFNFVFYVVDNQHVQFMGVDQDPQSPGTMTGAAVAQQGNVPNNVSAFNSSGFVFIMGGSAIGAGPLARAGRLTATGGNLSAILLDNNNGGTLIQVPLLNSGTVTLDGDNSGRGTFTFTDTATHTGTYSFVFYLNSATQGVIQDVSTTLFNGVPSAVDVADGALSAQTGAPFTASSLAADYAISWSGVSVDEEDFVGQFATSAANPNGTVDFNEFGGLNQQLFVNIPFNSVLTLGGDGTGSTGQHSTYVATLEKPTVNPINFFAYIANPGTIYVMGTASNRIILGVLTAQTQ